MEVHGVPANMGGFLKLGSDTIGFALLFSTKTLRVETARHVARSASAALHCGGRWLCGCLGW